MHLGFPLVQQSLTATENSAMTPDQYEIIAANWVRNFARARAAHNASNSDLDAATVAILARALELATPELSPQARGGLFLEEE